MSPLAIEKITSKETLMGLLYALKDSRYWSAEQFSDWATEVLISSDDPSVWTLDLIAVKDRSDLDRALQKICIHNNILVPNWVDEITTGLVLVRNRKGLLHDDAAVNALGELADTSGIVGLTPEEVYGDFSLEDERLSSAIARAITGTRWNGWVFFGLKNRRGA